MQIHHATQNIESSHLSDVRAATIVAGPAMFKLLSGLYSNPIRAIIREIACNALDAQKASERPNDPIQIFLPTLLHPTLTICDNGIGLSEEQVYNLFMGYGGTTKSGNNDAIGGFGIGSKAPLCYTDQFSIVSRHRGLKNTYLIFLDADMAPKIVKTDSMPYDGLPGVDVLIPIKAEDTDVVLTEAREVLSTLDFDGPIRIQCPRQEYVAKTDTFGVRKQDEGHKLVGTRVIMGGVAYPINYYDLMLAKGVNVDYSIPWRGIIEHSDLDLFLPIGAVTVAPSREALIYDKRTCEVLLLELRKLLANLQSYTAQLIDAVPTEWGRYSLGSTLKTTLDVNSNIILPSSHEHYGCRYNIVKSLLTADKKFCAQLAEWFAIEAVGKRYRPSEEPKASIHRIILVQYKRSVSKLKIIRAINARTKGLDTKLTHYVFFQMEDGNHQALIDKALAGAPIIQWETLLADLEPCYNTGTRRAKPTRKFLSFDLYKFSEQVITEEQYDELMKDSSVPIVYRHNKHFYEDAGCFKLLVDNKKVVNQALQVAETIRQLGERYKCPSVFKDILVVSRAAKLPHPHPLLSDTVTALVNELRDVENLKPLLALYQINTLTPHNFSSPRGLLYWCQRQRFETWKHYYLWAKEHRPDYQPLQTIFQRLEQYHYFTRMLSRSNDDSIVRALLPGEPLSDDDPYLVSCQQFKNDAPDLFSDPCQELPRLHRVEHYLGLAVPTTH